MDKSHTSANIERVLDSQIAKVPGLSELTRSYAVTDSAANILKSVRDCDRIYAGVRCIDHVIHTAVEAAFQTAIKSIVTHCKKIAAATHKSSKTCELIREACNETDTKYVKVIQPVKTRWHSLAMCIESVLRLKSALIKLKEKEDSDSCKQLKVLAKETPSKVQFDIMENLIPEMNFIKTMSERLSSEQRYQN